MLNTRRRINALEQRIAVLEATTGIDYTMPPAITVDMDPAAPILDHRPPTLTTPDDEDDTDWYRGPGLYL